MIAVLVGQGYRPKSAAGSWGSHRTDTSSGNEGQFPRPSCGASGCGRPSRRLTAPPAAPMGTGRVRAELRLGIAISGKTVHKLMAEERLVELPLRKHHKNLANAATFEDLVQLNFTRDAPDLLWVTDITEHPTREGKVYCCVVLDAHSRRVVGLVATPLSEWCTRSLQLLAASAPDSHLQGDQGQAGE